MTSAPDLDQWLADPAVRLTHRRESTAPSGRLWEAAHEIRLRDTSVLGRLIRWRIPGLPSGERFYQMFREPPFLVLCEAEGVLVVGLVGRIWTLRRDYPTLEDPAEYREWSTSGTAKVLFGNWVEELPGGGSALASEARVKAFGPQGRVGLASVRPLIRGFQHLVGTDAMASAVKRAEEA